MKTIFLLIIIAGSVMAADAVYSYKCTECGMIQQFTMSGVYHCPKDNTIMVSQ